MERDDKRAEALALRAAVLGPRYEEGARRAEISEQPVVAAWEEYLTDDAWAGLWARPGIPLKLRSLVTIVTLAVMGKANEMEGHLVGALRGGWTPNELSEVFIHVSRYAGYPAGVGAFRALDNVLSDPERVGTDVMTEESTA